MRNTRLYQLKDGLRFLSVSLGLLLLFLEANTTAAHLKVYVLTGQSNSLGTSNGTETDKSPGIDAADNEVMFWWENWAGAGIPTGNCTNRVTPLMVQQGGYYTGSATHWGPEFGFGRMLWKSGQRDFMIIKCSRGGGGNSFWHKPATDHHMYTYVCTAVSNAMAVLQSQGHTFEIVGLLYLQGESNSSAEAAQADARFRILLGNLRSDLPNAKRMKGYIAGIAASGTDRDTTRAKHDALYGYSAPEISFFNNLDLSDEVVPADGLHFNVRAKLCIGGRFADAVLGRLAAYDADLGAVQSPVMSGWSETTNTAPAGQSILGLSPDVGFTNNAWQIDDASSSVRGFYYTRQFSSNDCSWAAGLGWSLTARSRLITNYGAGSSWFFQYGDSTVRWVLNARVDNANQLILSWNRDALTLASKSVVIQTNYDNKYHDFILRNDGSVAGASTVLFDGVVVGSELPIAASPSALPQGISWGTASTAGMCKANWNRVSFALGTLTIQSCSIGASVPFNLVFSAHSNRIYSLYRSTNASDWLPILTNIVGTGSVTSVTDWDPSPSGTALYRMRINP